MKRILYYNWIAFDNPLQKGGGVTVYQRNLIEELSKYEELQLYFLSSGRAYDRMNKKVRIENTNNIFGENCKSYCVVNSPVLSSAALAFKDLDVYNKDDILPEVIGRFIEENRIDIVHYNNFEGLSLKVFELKNRFPKVKFVYSLHNYYSFCPQVNLWREEKEKCEDYHCGKECYRCTPQDLIRDKIIMKQSVSWFFEKRHWNVDNALSRFIMKRIDKNYEKDMKLMRNHSFTEEEILTFAKQSELYRTENVKLMNQNIDVILAVSKRVKEIAVQMGIHSDKVLVNYIGTKFAKGQKNYLTSRNSTGIMNIIYLGYARRDKGFFFLVDALKEVSAEVSSKIKLTFATKIWEKDTYTKNLLNELKNKYHDVIVYEDGYTHEQLEQILENQDLGIVPVLWEDNLPQVAIEMAAHGVPVLASNLGGASELSESTLFRFHGGDKKDFIGKLEFLFHNKHFLKNYYEEFNKLETMHAHVKKLLEIYDDANSIGVIRDGECNRSGL